MELVAPIYLDNASTTPVDPDVLDSMTPFFSEYFGNASSKDHIHGDIVKNAVSNARKEVANLLNAEPKEIIFTSGATEAINIGLIGFYLSNKHKGNHIITVSTEHKSVLESVYYLESIGADITILNVDSNGLIDFNELEKSIKRQTILVSVMYINNETGVIQDVKRISEICVDNDICFLCDASQAAGKYELDLNEIRADLLTLSAHKFHGPKGIGALYIRENSNISPILHGGGQEYGLRSGTLNSPLIVGFGKACELSFKNIKANLKYVSNIQSKIEKAIIQNNIGDIICKHVKRSAYISSVKLINKTADEFILKHRAQLSVSTGSACNSSIIEPSHVLTNLGYSDEDANRIVRLSYSPKIDDQIIEIIVNIFVGDRP